MVDYEYAINIHLKANQQFTSIDSTRVEFNQNWNAFSVLRK